MPSGSPTSPTSCQSTSAAARPIAATARSPSRSLTVVAVVHRLQGRVDRDVRGRRQAGRGQRPGEQPSHGRRVDLRRARCVSCTRTRTTRRATASIGSSIRRTARSTSTPTSSRSRLTACSRASTSRTSRPRYRLTVDAPADWAVVSATRSSRASRSGRTAAATGSRRPQPFSTYLLPLIGGPVALGRDGTRRRRRWASIARRSMARYLERRGRRAVRGHPPGASTSTPTCSTSRTRSRKYDQLFVPEFNAGAMENVGAVTFHDIFLFRDPPTETQRLTRAEVVLHELAHMWFGDLVTMRWWDDLWLNESFATYIVVPRARPRRPASRGAWQSFNGTLKPLAYREDQLVTTHPIAADRGRHRRGASSTSTASPTRRARRCSSSWWRPSARDAFREGMRAYFRRHAWGNATLADFLAALGEAARPRPSTTWARLWLGDERRSTPSRHAGRRDDGTHRQLHPAAERARRPPDAATARA